MQQKSSTLKQLKRAERVDILWGQYLENNMKSKTRKRCGSEAGLKGALTYLAAGSTFSAMM